MKRKYFVFYYNSAYGHATIFKYVKKNDIVEYKKSIEGVIPDGVQVERSVRSG